MQKLSRVRTRQQSSASLDYFVTSSPPYPHQFSAISDGNCITVGIQVSPADCGMPFDENELWIFIIITYVDDMLHIGKRKDTRVCTKIQKEFSVKIQHKLADYLGHEFHMNKVKTRGWLGQPSVIKSVEQNIGERII